MAEFTTVPSSITVAVGEEAVFQCNYLGVSLYWQINGTAVHNFPLVTVSTSGEQFYLTITALPEYNGIEVQCVALLQDFTVQRTPPVYLTINFSSKPKESYNYYNNYYI